MHATGLPEPITITVLMRSVTKVANIEKYGITYFEKIFISKPKLYRE